ncbi:hypothetical protein [Streptomyces olivaceoviridis]|uniref:hypothetical protein n=1 Tax=Streptomyces olivaceoviridis TaxID=1921 RepID=UPI0036C5EE54
MHQIYQCGSVLLGSDRPGEYWTLVVTGPQRGQVWWLRDGCAAPSADSPSAQLGGGFHGWIGNWHIKQGWWRPE